MQRIDMKELTKAELNEVSKFGKKSLTQDQLLSMHTINQAAQHLLETIFKYAPRSADQRAAIRSARLAAMQANAAVVWDTVVK